MSEKNVNRSGRARSKFVGIRMSPEEFGLFTRMASVCGKSKQDYAIARILGREVVVVPNVRVQKHLAEVMRELAGEVRRVDDTSGLSQELSEALEAVMRVFVALGQEEPVSERTANERAMRGMGREK